MGEHLPCKQGVKSSNLSVSIAMNIIIVHCRLYLENFIQNDDKIIEYLIRAINQRLVASKAINQRLVARDIVKP